ncbi:transposase [Nitrincola sp. A-D6]|uniref:Rpn family recombination-promoting nuclease/putative transposase n=1 Tax=Nitrincola sp. A-D6 TaxID=1545442 RepID=UPI00051FA733|nr:Rpn family recombination-promoting nuclease/putative transposase [Nitrincola sp. A-D6]KGK41299.1 transposase [Nitrincola sp. A-D6]
MAKHYDTAYKEVFSYPEFVQQLIEGFIPSEIASMMDFTSLELHSGNYITPLFENKYEDVVWSANVTWEGVTQPVYLYILLEFQSSNDFTMPIRLMHYVACFYDHLIKNKQVRPSEGLPPILPIVLYNGSKDWSAKEDIFEMISPEPPEFLKAHQPHLRYYLVNEKRYTEEELGLKSTPLSGMFSIENAGNSFEDLQRAVDRIVAIIKADPNKERIDKIVTRWIKRHLKYLGAEVNLDKLNSLVEDKDMLAENLEHLVQKERSASRMEGELIGMQKGRMETKRETALNLINMNILTDEQIAQASGLTLADIMALRADTEH